MNHSAADIQLPAAYWAHFTNSIVPFAETLSNGQGVREIKVSIEFDNASVFYVCPTLQDIDTWFRWAQAVDQERLRGRQVEPPPVYLLQPAPPKDFTFEIVDVSPGSLRVLLRSRQGALASLHSVVQVLSLWIGLTGHPPLEFIFEDESQRNMAPAPPADVLEQERGMFGIREGGHVAHSGAAEFEVVLDDGRTLRCTVRIPARAVDSDSEFIKEVSDACAQFMGDGKD
ncbi:hypothetical protein U9R90_26915 [Streptomyces sp. E11-3]|uniref:hypothetical protein n=1 Tax=Streptomyces sp. E11-3 TaxID=3110112 RepID=UPI0039819105